MRVITNTGKRGLLKKYSCVPVDAGDLKLLTPFPVLVFLVFPPVHLLINPESRIDLILLRLSTDLHLHGHGSRCMALELYCMSCAMIDYHALLYQTVLLSVWYFGCERVRPC